jgi:hypothetical protein
MLKLGLIFIFSFQISFLFSQEEVTRIEFKTNQLSIGFLGSSPIFGVNYEQMFNARLGLEVGLGSLGGGIGLKYYVTNPLERKFNFYSGVNCSYLFDGIPAFYLPAGIAYLGKKHFQTSLEVSPAFIYDITPEMAVYFSLKLGYRFGNVLTDKYEKSVTEHKRIVSFSLGATTPIAGVSYERFLNSVFSVEGGLGIISAGFGFKACLPHYRPQKINYHIGASYYFFLMPWAGGWKTYFPVGMNYLFKNNVRISLDLGPKIDWAVNFGSKAYWNPSACLRLGKAF